MVVQSFPILACTLLGILFIYGIVGIVLNAQELASTEGHGAWPYNQNPAHGALIVIQSFYLVTMTFGGLGFWRNERTGYYWAAAILLGVFVALFVFAVVCLRSSLKDMTADIFNSLKKSNGDPKEIEWFSMLQYEYKCCGVSSFNDWSILKTGLADNSVPETCCLRDEAVPKANCGAEVLSPTTTLEDIKELIYTDPCGPKMSPIIRSKAVYLGLEMLIAALVSLGTATFLYCGATELFCLAKGLDQTTPKRSGSMLNITEAGEDDENDTEDNRSNNNREINSREKIRFGIADKSTSNPNRNQNNSLKRGLELGGSGTGTLAKKSKGSMKSGTITAQKKGIKQQLINKGLIDKNKLQLNKLAKNERDWKGTARVASKALIFGTRMDSTAKFTTANVTAQNLIRPSFIEMLYEGIDKNVSTLSTTPNPSGSLTFPAISSKFAGGVSTKSPQKGNSTDKPLFPSLSHYSSLPLFHLVKFPNGDMGTLGQYSPHFAMNRNQRHTHRHTYFYTPGPQHTTVGSPVSGNTVTIVGNRCGGSPTSTASTISPSSVQIANLVKNGNVDAMITLESTILASTTPLNMNMEECDNPTLYPSPASTTVRSSTLATIQEESESVKGSPKGATPASPSPTGPEAMSPQLTNVNMFGGSFINDLSNVIGIGNPMIHTEIDGSLLHNSDSERTGEVVLRSVATGEFTPNLELLEVDPSPHSSNGINFMNAPRDDVSNTADLEGNNVTPRSEKDDFLKSDEFDGDVAGEIEETIAEIGALAKARASKAQFRLGFDIE